MRHEHHRGGHRPPLGPPPHRGRRPFDYGDLRLLVLSMAEEQPRHGYELIKAIEERTGGGYSPSPGVIYPTLAWLEDMGYAAASADGGRRRYAITEEGRAFLAANRAALEAVAERAGRGEGGRRPAPEEVASAMHALKHALRRRFAAPPADPATVEGIAAAIRAATETVEQTMADMTPEFTEAGETVREVAEVPTGHAQRYLGQLCKHFAHKVPVDFDETSGTIRFDVGICRVRADAATLTLDLQAAPDKMERLKDVVVRHLVRFAFREELPIAWKAA
ncbi:MAG: DUF2218 domain-containing protein [Amaricoccus sp.]